MWKVRISSSNQDFASSMRTRKWLSSHANQLSHFPTPASFLAHAMAPTILLSARLAGSGNLRWWWRQAIKKPFFSRLCWGNVFPANPWSRPQPDSITTTMVTSTFLCSIIAAYCFSTAVAGDTLKLPLIRPSVLPTPQQSLSLDVLRLSVLDSAGETPELPISTAGPVVSSATTGADKYLVDILAGTPPQRLLLAVDTGSDLVWVRCSACRDCSRHVPGAAFFARRSSSFAPYHCYDRQCRLVPRSLSQQSCPSDHLHSPCRYQAVAEGFLSRDTAAVNSASGDETYLRPLSFGCVFNVSRATAEHGIMGLGRGPLSFPSQVSRRYGNTFSYCLRNSSSFLLFGDSKENLTLRYTPLLTNPLCPTLYYVGIEGASVDGVELPIESTVWAMDHSTGAGGMVVDSGTTITFLPDPAYRQVLAAMESRVRLPRVPGSGFDLCVNGSAEEPSRRLPRLGLKLAGGEMLAPPPKNYFLETEPGVWCLALLPVYSPDGFGVIGTMMQQGFLFVFDRDGARLGFSRNGCERSL